MLSQRRFDYGRELLKIVAIITMVIDHVGRILYPDLLYLQIIGRLSFPLFAYLVVLRVESTKKPRRYMLTLLIFALISQVPYVYAFQIQPFERLNILFSLFLSTVTIYFFIRRNLMAFIPLFLSIILMTEGSYYVVLSAVAMKLFKDNAKFGALALFALNIQFLFFPNFETQIQVFALFSIPLIFLHLKNVLRKEVLIPEDSLAYSIRKLAFYLFYPLHLALLFLINLSLF